MGLKDEDFFIDLRLGSQTEINNLYKANLENRGKEGGVSVQPITDGKGPYTQSLGKKGDVADNLKLDPLSPKARGNTFKT